MKNLIHEALDTAQRLGAEYADVRGTRFRRTYMNVRIPPMVTEGFNFASGTLF